jgi:hypothetical protein
MVMLTPRFERTSTPGLYTVSSLDGSTIELSALEADGLSTQIIAVLYEDIPGLELVDEISRRGYPAISAGERDAMLIEPDTTQRYQPSHLRRMSSSRSSSICLCKRLLFSLTALAIARAIASRWAVVKWVPRALSAMLPSCMLLSPAKAVSSEAQEAGRTHRSTPSGRLPI